MPPGAQPAVCGRSSCREADDDERSRRGAPGPRLPGTRCRSVPSSIVARGERAARVVDEPAAAPPRRRGERARSGAAGRATRAARAARARACRRPRSPPSASRRPRVKRLPLSATSRRARPRPAVLRLGVRLLELLGDDEPLADDDQRGGERGQRETERQAEPLRAVRDGIERVDGDERERGQRREAEQREHHDSARRSGAPAGTMRSSGSRSRGGRLPATSTTADTSQSLSRVTARASFRSRGRPRRARPRRAARRPCPRAPARAGRSPSRPGSSGCFA